MTAPRTHLSRLLPLTRAFCAVALASLALVALPAGARAAVMTFGSPLSTVPTKDTAQSLNYPGKGIPYGSTVIHVAHDGADTALWNTALPGGASPTAPEGGQITSVRLEGCAEPAAGGPPPLTQIHFQALTPITGGGADIDVTSQPFTIPTCGVGGASPQTVTSYQPTNFCVNRGDIVDFNDEGGFDPQFYPSGVQYRVIGSVAGAMMSSFIDNNGTNNGMTMASTSVGTTNGFAHNSHEELMLQSTLATGVNATPLCPGGLYGEPGQPGGKPALAFGQETAGVNHQGEVPIAVYCDLVGRPCAGTISLVESGRTLGSVALTAPTGTVTVVQVHVGTALIATLRHGDIPITAIAQLSGAADVSHPMALRL